MTQKSLIAKSSLNWVSYCLLPWTSPTVRERKFILDGAQLIHWCEVVISGLEGSHHEPHIVLSPLLFSPKYYRL